MNQSRTLEQERAKHAWQAVQKAKQDNVGKEFGRVARSLPADIQANGLGQTLAFLRAKGHNHVFDAVSDWAKQRLNHGSDNLLEWITQQATSEDYRRATAEVIAYAIWLKRFAEAELKED
ncbi:MAG: type III-B CRISPR module-associated protein Cmr5 [Thermoflexales bacterium]|nr:type III-B CRISPR module-associated protein Cmr5 [Thermoflexales bacterium]